MTAGAIFEVLTGVAAVLSAVAAIIAARRSDRVLVKATAIETATNGAAAAATAHRRSLEAKVEALERQLSESFAERLADAVVAKQAANDVRSAMAQKTPEGAG